MLGRVAQPRGVAWVGFGIGLCLVIGSRAVAADSNYTVSSTQGVVKEYQLADGDAVEISVGIEKPSLLPPNARLLVAWTLTQADDPAAIPRAPRAATEDSVPRRALDAFNIYTAPTANWSKVLHALDADTYVVYRAPTSGRYTLVVQLHDGPAPSDGGKRWRDTGAAPGVAAQPERVEWPEASSVEIFASVAPLVVADELKHRFYVEAEPNDTPEQAQPLDLGSGVDAASFHVMGTSDDIEYFDNGRVGASGDDWFRIDFAGSERRLLTVCLSIPDQQLAARIRCYTLGVPGTTGEKASGAETVAPLRRIAAAGELLSLVEYDAGKNLNERSHQQEEQHRTAINRWVEPGETYFLRVEANAPGYELELRVVQPAPFDDPRVAVRHGLYDHIGQVDAWLTNRPRGASVERRIRDSGNLLGTNCMSCHTQSGVWGPAIPFVHGYRPENVQLWRHLINTCYQSMRPTNKLIDAANNTSLRPLDIGDGPAGTRVAGHAVVALERYLPARKLQSSQAIRAANYVLQTSDPGGINAAGPGANVGKGVVFNYAGEILWSAWRATSEPKYFHALEDKMRKILEIDPKYSDDLGHRIEFLQRYVPRDYVDQVALVAGKDGVAGDERTQRLDAARELAARIAQQVRDDIDRLRAIQLEDGAWGFDPGARGEDGSWVVKNKKADPSPTALALIAFEAAGVKRDDPTVAKGIQALLKQQLPTGLWKVESATGFVGTSYALHALARYFPTDAPTWKPEDFASAEGEPLVAALRRVRDLSTIGSAEMIPLLVEAASDASPLVRYWAMIGLGASPSEASVAPLVAALDDRAKPVREAAHWALRQNLIDDRGWDDVFAVLASGGDRARESALRALVMKVDGVLTHSRVGWERLVAALDRSMNDDPHPGVRAWTMKAAWQWWIWNPPVRAGINAAWTRLLQRPEENIAAENTLRYQSHALLIANGHVANGSKEHQYTELGDLLKKLREVYTAARKNDAQLAARMTKRLVALAATYHGMRGGDGGPGQMGYITPGASELFSDAILSFFPEVEALSPGAEYERRLQLVLEGAANIPRKPLQEKLIKYSLEGPEKFRALASSSISDPKLVQLVAVPERLEPMYAQLQRGAREPDRRPQLSEPILKMFGRVRWLIPESREQRESILEYLIPAFDGYPSRAEIEAVEDAATRAEKEQAEESHWYLASRLGAAIAENIDLHFDTMTEAFPQSFGNDAEAQFWLRSVAWILGYKRDLPNVVIDPEVLPPLDPHEELRTRAVSLFLTQLTPEAEARNRKTAVALANGSALRRNPEILTALEALVSREKDQEIVETAKKALSNSRGQFMERLRGAVKAESPRRMPADSDGEPAMPPEFVEDFVYFRDYVAPEMYRVLRTDSRSCIACHGKKERTPMFLHEPDDVGYLPVDQLLENYRTLQARIDYRQFEASKILRKPLNIQTGKEDGHQGGRRYGPDDPGYELLRRWVLHQVEHQAHLGILSSPLRMRRF